MSVQHEVRPTLLGAGDAVEEGGEVAQHLTEAPSAASGSTVASSNDAPEQSPAPQTATVSRRASLHAVVGLGAGALAVGYLLRAQSTATVLSWLIAGVLGAVAVWHLLLLVDSRSPLLVADRTGVRVRNGRRWRGLRWVDIAAATVESRRGLRDGTVAISATPADESALTVPLGLATVTSGDFADALHHLQLTQESPTAAPTLDAVPQRAGSARPQPTLALARQAQEAPADAEPPQAPNEAEQPPAGEPVASPAAVLPAVGQPETAQRETAQQPARRPRSLLRALRPALRSEVTNPASSRAPVTAGTLALAESAERAGAELPEIGQLRRSGPGNVSLLVTAADHPTEASADQPVAEPATEPAEPTPVIGPQIRAAREQLAASIDDIATRTCIRPHVLEALEVDDFEPCGGDFYARGHIRAVSRVLGLDAEPLLRTYDERYAAAPISPRTVFQADLATGPTAAMRRGGDGPNWGMLMGVVLVLTLVWGIARLVVGG